MDMNKNTNQKINKIIIIPCSGIGKSFGTIGREATYIVTDELQPEHTRTLCLSLLTMKDSDSLNLIQHSPTITIDGCPKMCAKINVEKNGASPVKSYKVFDFYKEHRDLKTKSVSSLEENGFKLARIVAKDVSASVTEILKAKE